jgi:L-fucose isomerase-like protein
MKNVPEVILGIVAVSRNCFPIELSGRRRDEVFKHCLSSGLKIKKINTIIEAESDIIMAEDELIEKGVNALIVYLGNFGPEGPATTLAQRFDGPVMFAAAAEDGDLMGGRGDAYCGMLNASYNIGLRGIRPYIPEYPVGTPSEISEMIADFIPVARVMLGLKYLKIFTFGPRPQDFLACNAPIKPLYDLGIEVMENSELDLLEIYQNARESPLIKKIAASMKKEMAAFPYPDLLPKLAQYEACLLEFMDKNLGVNSYAIFANKCWPAFEKFFGFVPCYINSRLAGQGIPVSCEVDIYGALSEYIAVCATGIPATLLDINNTIPAQMYKKSPALKKYKPTDLFMGFHCGNTPSGCLINPELKYQLIMHRLMESNKEPNITRGTMEGRMTPGKATIFRLQATADACLNAYIAQGKIIDHDTPSFGSIAVIAIKEMARFYRHVLIEKRFPHHTAVVQAPAGRAIFSALKMLGIRDIYYNLPEDQPYPTENPF